MNTAEDAVPVARAVARRHFWWLDQDDLVSEAILRVLRYLPQFDAEKASFEAWARYQAHSAMRDFLRHEKFGARGRAAIPVMALNRVVPAHDPEGPPVEFIELLPDPADEPRDVINRVAIEQASSACHGREWPCIYLRHFKGWELTEIADLYGADPSRISRQITSGLARMRIHMEATRRPTC